MPAPLMQFNKSFTSKLKLTSIALVKDIQVVYRQKEQFRKILRKTNSYVKSYCDVHSHKVVNGITLA